MKRSTLAIVFLAGWLGAFSLGQSPTGTEKKEWQIIRDPGTNDCIVAKITAQHPQYPEQLGTYASEKDAKAALAVFKKTEDPKKTGFEICTNK